MARKTFKILELLHMDPQVPPTGLVVANVADLKRCNRLISKMKQMCSPNMMVTSHDATKFPTRKRIEDEVGGRLVYSTRSLNPIEDEAVVADVLRRTKGAMELVDVSDTLPLLKRMPGISGWRVYDSTRPNQAEVGVLLGRFSSYKEAEHLRSKVDSKLVIDPSFFKNGESDRMPLERCMRVLPHHQDTEGLFIAVLEKVRDLPDYDFSTVDHRWEGCSHRPDRFRCSQRRKKGEKEASTDDSSEHMDGFLKDRPRAFQNDGDYPQIFRGIDPVILLDRHPLVQNVTKFYGIEGFDLGKYLISRMVKDGHARRVYFTFSNGMSTRTRSFGVPFTTCPYCQRTSLGRGIVPSEDFERLPFVLKYITKRILYVNVSDAIRFLVERSLPLPEDTDQKKDAVASEKHNSAESIPVSDATLLEQLEDFDDGGAVLMLRDSDAQALGFPLSTEAQGGLTAKAPVAVSCWRTRGKINIMMSTLKAKLLAERLKEARAEHFPEDVEEKDSKEREDKSRRIA
ncbi:hypothetical protein BSKO_05909 [Bryopsis sp. KO-2023]|nr:hypothetical protein BSKO_05909 [Bryopsis sp. KO-2023]